MIFQNFRARDLFAVNFFPFRTQRSAFSALGLESFLTSIASYPLANNGARSVVQVPAEL